MYILLERYKARSETCSLYDYDAVGYVKSADDAEQWVNQNYKHRTYKYCPDKEINILH